MIKVITAAIIATGNEVVSGQILNSNTRYLASNLSQIGVEVVYHFSVLDRREDLEKVLKFLKEKSIEQVFIIGGLGPTSDDLTRYIVADFFEQDFEFSDVIWSKVADLLKDRSVALKEGHKKQCYFPIGSEILVNSVGTAQGFRTIKDDMSIWCIPGPPSECKSVYENAIAPWALATARPSTNLLTWQCIGVPESDVSSKVEEALKTCSYEIGFRASPPIVEVKLWVPFDHMGGVSQVWIDEIERVVEPHLYSRQGQNYFKDSLDFLIQQGEVDIVDEFSKGYVYEELLAIYEGEIPERINFSTKPVEHSFENIITLSAEDGVLDLSFSSLNKNFIIRLDVDLDKAAVNKRLRKTKCAELFKLLHKNIFT
jgi:molybdenum cofactor synthesis domain-containing protein